MDNQAFHSSRDSNLSIEISPSSPPHKQTSTKPYNHLKLLTEQSLNEKELESHLKEILEIQMRKQNSLKGCDVNEHYVPYSEVPLVDALQNNCKTIIHVQESPNGSTSNRFNSHNLEKNEDVVKREEENIRNEFLYHDSQGDNLASDVAVPFRQVKLDSKNHLHRTTSTQFISRSVQVWPTPPYRLRVLPRPISAVEGRTSILGYIGRCIFCQVGLSILLFVWTVVGAFAFHYTEGPAEIEKVAEQKALVDNLVQELMQSPRNDQTLWHSTVERYMYRHEIAWSEGGTNADLPTRTPGRVWSLPGCTLFAISLITTLGFGAPVPRTPEGRSVAVIFAAIGIPMHLILVLNIGMVIAVKLQKLASRNAKSDNGELDDREEVPKNDNFTDITKSNGIISGHRRSGSEPIGRQAITNITREANFIINEGMEHKYEHIPEGELKLEDKEFKTNINNFLPVKKRETSYEICNFKTLQTLTKDGRKIYKDIGSQPKIMPVWLKWLPFIGIAIYYTAGVLMFGFGRGQYFLDSLMFPLDFTVAGGVAHTIGYIRVLYGVYLEGAVVLAASTVSILQVTATKGFTDVGLRYGLLTNSR